MGDAYEVAHRPEATRAARQIALTQVQERLKGKPTDSQLLGDEAYLLACLGDAKEAGRAFQLYREFKNSGRNSSFDYLEAYILMRIGRKEEVLARLASYLNARHAGWEAVHANARYGLNFDPLRGDPSFEKLFRDNLPRYAKPFDEPAIAAP